MKSCTRVHTHFWSDLFWINLTSKHVFTEEKHKFIILIHFWINLKGRSHEISYPLCNEVFWIKAAIEHIYQVENI